MPRETWRQDAKDMMKRGLYFLTWLINRGEIREKQGEGASCVCQNFMRWLNIECVLFFWKIDKNRSGKSGKVSECYDGERVASLLIMMNNVYKE